MLHVKIFFFVFCCLLCVGCVAQQRRFSFIENKMGSPFQLIFYAKDSMEANHLAKEAFLRVDSLNEIFSDYLPNSSLSQLNANATTGQFYKVPPQLYEIIRTGIRAGHQSGGAFDISIGTLSTVWRQAIRQKTFPAVEDIHLAKKSVYYRGIELDTVNQRIKLPAHM